MFNFDMMFWMNFKLNNQTIFGLVSQKVKVSNYHENLPMQNTEKISRKTETFFGKKIDILIKKFCPRVHVRTAMKHIIYMFPIKSGV